MRRLKCCILGTVKLLVGVRKMIMALIFIALGLLLLSLKFITGTVLIETTRDVMVALMATNMAEHLAEAISKWGIKK